MRAICCAITLPSETWHWPRAWACPASPSWATLNLRPAEKYPLSCAHLRSVFLSRSVTLQRSIAHRSIVHRLTVVTIEAHHQVDLPFNNHICFTNESQSLKQFTPSMRH